MSQELKVISDYYDFMLYLTQRIEKFPSIDHELLKGVFRRLIRDRDALRLMDLIVDSSNAQEPAGEWFEGDDLFAPVERRRGLPIGNLTSQWFANWFLNDLDHAVTSAWGFGAYVRYCDDLIILDDDRHRLVELAERMRGWLGTRRLRLNENKLAIRPTRAGLTFVGYRTWASHRLLRKSNVRAFRRRVRWMRGAYAQGRIGWPDVKLRLDSWMGHAAQADSARLIRRLSGEWRFSRDRAVNGSCVARRLVEQQSTELPLCQPQQQHARQPEQQQRVSCCPALPRQA